MRGTKPGVAIVGLGLIARTHAVAYQRLAALVDLVSVCDIDRARAEQFASEFGARACFELQEVIDDPAVDVIDLILPHHLHHQAAMAVLEAGKHLIIEKPVASTYREAMDICLKAGASGVHFMIAENTRYVAAYMAAERVLRAGDIGDVIHARTTLRSNEKDHLSQPGYWRTEYALGGGLILDTGAHSFYLLKWLLGEFEEVTGFSAKLFPLENEIEDTAEVYGRLSNGAHISCTFTSVSEMPHSERLELYGTHGSIIVDQMADPVVRVFRGHQDFGGQTLQGVPFGPDGWHPGGWHYESVITEVTDYIESLLEGRPPLIENDDAAYAIQVVEAAYRSITEGVPITLQ
jgi:UDP-N-acetyl-2-amino-2-deoxyglucuronate dehydrogenase